jgi:hypothetical protein
MSKDIFNDNRVLSLFYSPIMNIFHGGFIFLFDSFSRLICSLAYSISILDERQKHDVFG